MKLIRYVMKRAMLTLPALLGVTLLIFALIRFIPGDPARAILLTMFDPSTNLSDLEKDAEVLHKQLGLDQPFPVQYATWLWKIAHGDLGVSFRSKTPILDELLQRLPATLELAGAALLVMVLIAIPSGIAGAVYHRRTVDHTTRIIALIGVSVPSFFLGLVLMYVLSVKLGWLPTMGRGGGKHLILPALTLGIGLSSVTARLLRTSLLQVFSQRYMILAEAKGLHRRTILFKHALPNALLPVLTSFGLVVGGLIGGTVIIETVFSWPGVGRYVVDAITGRDYPVIQAFALLMAVVYIVLNLAVDITYRWMDPRVRMEQEGQHG
ncbi:Nickel transport system permease protein NikB [Paenibacillus solanacearum]|uniref:Nickel import system permease protein NikB n=1 Tax=Paenibacillus solanacearum TaxID=2048548 RepID=A0A916K4D8_9BACL|nr:nickel ABC transporter permease [Paenibacillus solanacearum]CAG7637020.1 Nickel transport system permease protein NikB [Paenibacillus solanacearum]